GQHFLTDKMVLNEIIDLIKRNYTDEKLVEIGPGTGALTNLLVKEFDSVTCVEVDKRCIDFLKTNLQPTYPNLEIIDADFLKL
ncbi:MAG TPA: rRNA adenine N-6-methyltransferase family protein, partial [Chitinophagales bacterium]|nr:rRNA adenine N-6-methyltransferase family protein [Chitinophagales bacterium]